MQGSRDYARIVGPVTQRHLDETISIINCQSESLKATRSLSHSHLRSARCLKVIIRADTRTLQHCLDGIVIVQTYHVLNSSWTERASEKTSGPPGGGLWQSGAKIQTGRKKT
jgi:metal-responsive CopG/Arc/MetJ family transcriptional regulator